MKRCFIILLFIPIALVSQIEKYKTKGISVSLFDENTNYPSLSLIKKPIHPGISVSFDWNTKQKEVYSFTHVFQLGYYHHKNFHQALFLAWKPKFEWKFRNRINLHMITGIGYLHSFSTQQTYKFIDGEYTKKANWGKSHLKASLGSGFGYSFSNFDVFTRYEWFVIGPYASDFPLSSHTTFSIGLTLYPFKK